MTTRAILAIAFVLGACSPKRSPPPDTTAAPRSSPAPAAPTASPATSEATAETARCVIDVPARVEFLECYPRPRTVGFPDCRQYVLERIDGEAACLPARLSLGISGFQSIADTLRVEVRWEVGPPRRATLLFERTEASVLGNDEKLGTPMGTLVFDRGGPRELLLGPGMRRYTDQTKAKRLE